MLRKHPRHLLGAVPVLYGSDLTTDWDVVRRTWTALINSFLHPAMDSFVQCGKPPARLPHQEPAADLPQRRRRASRVAKTVGHLGTYSSGPWGGMECMKTFARLYDLSDVVAIDVGGTTTDIGSVPERQGRGGAARLRGEGISVSYPQRDHECVGGWQLHLQGENNRIVIGPRASVRCLARPASGPRWQAEATITDASLLSGLFDPKSFFGGGMGP
ncbi:hydantoinase/oxoprolinase family protein [Zoogloea sp.]|uniref:hydantoinase/oxoprolinase family protein n=1 Tax=Zoogloea sp. TaxID=49181 RepID=UPI001E112F4B|nr:hydantoinase/oxoprolinase family protein [Zoogloea sp.]MBK6652388.1 hypothetical protein [Zoogloea sp.]